MVHSPRQHGRTSRTSHSVKQASPRKTNPAGVHFSEDVSKTNSEKYRAAWLLRGGGRLGAGWVGREGALEGASQLPRDGLSHQHPSCHTPWRRPQLLVALGAFPGPGSGVFFGGGGLCAKCLEPPHAVPSSSLRWRVGGWSCVLAHSPLPGAPRSGLC